MAFDNPHGFVPIDPIPDNGTMKFAVTGTTVIRTGDLVTIIGGLLDVATANSGSVCGVALEPGTGDGNNGVQVLVCIDPNMRYVVQADDNTVVITDIGTTFDVVITAGSGDYSAHELDGDASSAAGDFLILLGIKTGPQVGGGKMPGYSTANTECIVKLNPVFMDLENPGNTV